MPKRNIPKELLAEPFEVNIEWLNKYADEKNIKKAKYQKLLNFFSYKSYELRAFNEFTYDDIKIYTDLQFNLEFSIDTIHYIISALSSFRDYLIIKYPDKFNSQFLNNINTLKDSYGEPNEAGKPLNLVQLGLIRRFNNEDKHQKIKYVFELLFQLGIEKKDIKYCTPENLRKNEDTWLFEKPNGTDIILNDVIKNLIVEYEDTEYMEKNSTMINDYFKNMSDYLRENNSYDLERNINVYDIKSTRKSFFITCPNCKRVFETFSENWVLAKAADIDNDYHLVCRICKGEPMDED